MTTFTGMTRKRKQKVFKKVLLSVIFIPLLFIPAVFAQDLFQESYSFPSIEEEREFYTDPTILRNRRVMLDRFQLLESAANNTPVNLNLFGDVELRATLKKSHPSSIRLCLYVRPLRVWRTYHFIYQ